MLNVNFRPHEMGTRPRVRVWTDQDANYGSFEILEYKDFAAFREIGEKVGMVQFTQHHCQTNDECEHPTCRVLDKGEKARLDD